MVIALDTRYTCDKRAFGVVAYAQCPYGQRTYGMNAYGTIKEAQFISSWKTDNVGSPARHIILPLDAVFTNMVVDWGDGSSSHITSHADPAKDHTYAVDGTYTIQIIGNFSFKFAYGGDRLKILDISQWGCFNIQTTNVFAGCLVLECTATDAPAISATDLRDTFRACAELEGVGDAAGWDLSAVTNISEMFWLCYQFNQDISMWDVSNVTTLYRTFAGCWVFDQDISSWDVSSVTTMYQTFKNAEAFNQDISAWDTGAVINMESMFESALLFDQDIDIWDTSLVETMRLMFHSALVFNQDIGSWDTGAVTTMHGMFDNADAFDQDLSGWDISLVVTMDIMFDNKTVPLSTANYSAMLVAWEAGAHQAGVTAHFGNATYSLKAAAAHAELVADGWTITDGGDEIPGLVAFFRMGTADCATPTVYDHSTTNNNGTSDNALNFVTGRDAVANRAIQFDPAANDQIVVTDNAAYDITNTLSVSVWFKNDEALLADAQTITGKYHLTGRREWMLRIDADEKVKFNFSSNGTNVGAATDSWTSTNAIEPNRAGGNHLIFTYNSGTMAVRLNGAALAGDWAAGGIASIFNSTANIEIGSYDNSTSYWDGAIQDFLMYNRVITGAEIAILEAGDF